LPSTVKELPSAASRHSFHLPCTVSNCSMYAVQDGVYVYQDGVYACTYTADQDGVRVCREKHARALTDVHTNVHAQVVPTCTCLRSARDREMGGGGTSGAAQPPHFPLAGGLRAPLLVRAGGREPEVLAPPLISLTCTICRFGYLRGRSAWKFGEPSRRAPPGAERSVEEGGRGEPGIRQRGGTQIVQCAAHRHVRACRGMCTCPRCRGMRAGRCARIR
jgi:hypothetical protein